MSNEDLEEVVEENTKDIEHLLSLIDLQKKMIDSLREEVRIVQVLYFVILILYFIAIALN